jgi:hypothetical protein
MDTLRLDVRPRGKGYVAQSTAPEATALGLSPEEAVESARKMALALFANGPRPTMLLVYFNEPGIHTIIMQPIEKPFTLTAVAEDVGWRYMASVTDDAAVVQAVSE